MLQSLVDEMDELYDENDRLRQCVIDESRVAPIHKRLRQQYGELQQQLQEKEKELMAVRRNLETIEQELKITKSRLRFELVLLSAILLFTVSVTRYRLIDAKSKSIHT
jgi:flagellar motility protein MotE (MotC chaperone)